PWRLASRDRRGEGLEFVGKGEQTAAHVPAHVRGLRHFLKFYSPLPVMRGSDMGCASGQIRNLLVRGEIMRHWVLRGLGGVPRPVEPDSASLRSRQPTYPLLGCPERPDVKPAERG